MAIQKIGTWLFVLFLAITAMAGCRQRQPLRTGDSVESVVLEDIHGRLFKLPDDVRGKAIVLRFWSIECPSCCKEMLKVFEKLYQKHKEQGLSIVTVNVHQTPNTLDEFRKLEGVSYPLLIDPNSKIAQRFGVAGLPTTFILDGQGIVREKIVGDMDVKEFEKLIVNLLNEGGSHDDVR